MACTKCHGTGELYPQGCGMYGLTTPCPSCALAELIAGDADLYDLQHGSMTPEQCVMVCPQCEGEGTHADGLDEAACSTICTRCESNGWIVDVHSYEYASARIKGDKDRLASRAPPLEYDHTQDGTANFERANAQAEQFERDYYLKCDEHERDMKDAATFMGKRDAHIELLTELAHQYLSDLRYPPSPDSKERRIDRITAALKAMKEQTDGE